jgi:hypothetical protein
MPEIKNTFLQSKMNKDLDSRIIPNGQYRDAQNININKSEGDDVGAIENILGNIQITNFGFTDPTAEIIGKYFDNINERIYVFITNYNDSSLDRLSNSSASYANNDLSSSTVGVNSALAYYDLVTNSYGILLFGSWLNFSKTHEILNVTLLENLLYWTDNRNQPRKINVDRASSAQYDLTIAGYNNPYYTNEDQISVAKYYPYKSVQVVQNNTVTGATVTTPGSGYDEVLVPLAITQAAGQITTSGSGSGLEGVLELIDPSTGALQYFRITNGGSGYVNGDTINILPASGTGVCTVTVTATAGMRSKSIELLPNAFAIRFQSTGLKAAGTSIPINPGTGTGTISWLPQWVNAIINIKVGPTATVTAGTFITSATTSAITLSQPITVVSTDDVYNVGVNPDYDVNYEGDRDFLKDRFVKFAYRFKFDDNEYSLISPFTQECFVPNQDGYFLSGDQASAFDSTIVDFMENKIDFVQFRIPAPDKLDGTSMNWSEANSLLKIQSLDIIYTDSDGVALKVVDTLTQEQILNNNDGTTYLYSYKSRKPIRTLPEKDLTRVSDKVPARAQTQETVGNRIIYANYTANLGRPENLDYSVQVSDKIAANDPATGLATPKTLQIEYPNSNVKQNRTYQVGVVLCDRYGRQSDVILSSNDANAVLSGYGGSTYYHEYFTENDPLSTFVGSARTDIWDGDSLKVLFNQVIPSTSPVEGYAGLYNTNGSNPIGWYSYKIVVKQQEQEYYNAYLPGILNGYPISISPGFENAAYSGVFSTNTAHTVVIGDNINKIPRNLQEVGPEDKEFSSDVNFFTRVTQTNFYQGNAASSQYYPDVSPDSVSVIGTYTDLKLSRTNPQDSTGGVDWTTIVTGNSLNNLNSLSPFYNIPGNNFPGTASTPTLSDAQVPFESGNNQLIARLSTRKLTGILGGMNSTGNFSPWSGGTNGTNNVLWYQNPGLSIIETEPVTSALDIYYETSTSQSIANLNAFIISGDIATPAGIQPLNFFYPESLGPGTDVTSDFYPLAPDNTTVLNNSTTTLTLLSATTTSGLVNYFEVIKNGDNSFKLRTRAGVYNWFKANSWSSDNFTFNFRCTNTVAGVVKTGDFTITPPNLLSNAQPGWIDNGGSAANPPVQGSTPYGASALTSQTGFDTTYAQHSGTSSSAPNTSTSPDPFPSNLALQTNGNIYQAAVALNGFNGSAGGGIGGAPLLIKNQLKWIVKKTEFYWEGKPGGAAWEVYNPSSSDLGANGYSYLNNNPGPNQITVNGVYVDLDFASSQTSAVYGGTGGGGDFTDTNTKGSGITMSSPPTDTTTYPGVPAQVYPNISESVFHRLRALNVSGSRLAPVGNNGPNNPVVDWDGNGGTSNSIKLYVYPAYAVGGFSATNASIVSGWKQMQTAGSLNDTQYRVTLEVADINDTSGALTREIQLTFFVTPSSEVNSGFLPITGPPSGGGPGGQR